MEMLKHPLHLIWGPPASGKTKALTWYADEAYMLSLKPLLMCGDTSEFKAQYEWRFPNNHQDVEYVNASDFGEVMSTIARLQSRCLILLDDFDFMGPLDSERPLSVVLIERLGDLARATKYLDHRIVVAVRAPGIAQHHFPNLQLLKPDTPSFDDEKDTNKTAGPTQAEEFQKFMQDLVGSL